MSSGCSIVSSGFFPRFNSTLPEEQEQIMDYLPKINTKLEDDATNAKIQDCEIARLPKDLIIDVMCNLDPVALANASRVCQLFYSVSKSPLIWKTLFQNSFPRLKAVCLQDLRLEHTVKLIFAQYKRRKADLLSIEKKLRAEIAELNGPNGNDGTIHKAVETNTRYKNGQLGLGPMNYYQLTSNLFEIAGIGFKSDDATIDPSSKLGKVLDQIKKADWTFKDQSQLEKFIKVIQKGNDAD